MSCWHPTSMYTDEQASEFCDNVAQMIKKILKSYAIIIGSNINTAIRNSTIEDEINSDFNLRTTWKQIQKCKRQDIRKSDENCCIIIWNIQKLISLYKAKGGVQNLNNWRGICLKETIAKIVSSIVVK